MSNVSKQDADTEAARAVVNVIMQWVVSPLVETGKAVAASVDRASVQLERIADAIDRASPPPRPTEGDPP